MDDGVNVRGNGNQEGSREERWIAVVITVRIRIVEVSKNVEIACKLTKHLVYATIFCGGKQQKTRQLHNNALATHAWNLAWKTVIRIKYGLN